MDAILLAGGEGTRLREVVPEIPKPLAKCGKKPFLELLFEQLYTFQGIEKVILAVGYKSEQIVAHFEKYPPQLPIIYSFETTPLGTGGALKKAAEFSESENLLVMNGDSLLQFPWLHFIASHREKEADLTIACSKVEEVSRYGKVIFDPQTHRLTKFHEKNDATGSGWINGGVYLFRKKIVESFPPHIPCSLEKETIPLFLDQQIYGFPCEGLFIDIGTKESYNYAQTLFK